jgi:hypothetical protein
MVKKHFLNRHYYSLINVKKYISEKLKIQLDFE